MKESDTRRSRNSWCFMSGLVYPNIFVFFLSCSWIATIHISMSNIFNPFLSHLRRDLEISTVMSLESSSPPTHKSDSTLVVSPKKFRRHVASQNCLFPFLRKKHNVLRWDTKKIYPFESCPDRLHLSSREIN